MSIRIAINGYGRIGRGILRAVHELDRTSEFDIVAINDLGDLETNALLTRYDTAHGRFSTVINSRSSPSATRRSCPGRISASTWSWNAPGCSGHAKPP